jgi:hypothetical protein
MAQASPELAASKIEMRAMTGESPAVVECPDNWFVNLFKVVEEETDMEVITVQVMEVNNIGI